ncbi:MAG TPA: protein kinase [Kofleriaceae bacterium]|nr:protein kinase [Kofleriaceae bacterium]
MIDQTIKDWKVVEKVGRGGMGEVWVAEQRIVKTKVAIKLLLADVSSRESDVQRFFNEAVAVSKIKHAGIVRIFDVGFHESRAYLVMEMLEGETLSARIRRTKRLGIAAVADLGRQIASVLEATHAAGITHRDLKPDNIFIVADHELASKERVKVLDFGIAKLGEAPTGLTTSTSMGTPAYMAPEQWNNAAKADGRADVYSLGCVLFEMWCGRPPFLPQSMGEACTMHLTHAPPRASSIVAAIPAELDELIANMLAKAPADRPAIGEVTRVLGLLAAAHPPSASAMASTEPVGAAALAATIATDKKGLGTDKTAIGTDKTAIATDKTAIGTEKTVLGTDKTVLGTDQAVGAAVTAPSTRAAAGNRKRYVIAGGCALALAGAVAIYLAIARKPAAPLREPTYGLQTVASYRDPTPATIGTFGSESLWLGARDDFATACKQRNAPARWCAGAELCAGEAFLVTGKLAEAEPHFQAAIKLDPTWAAPHLGLHDIRSFNNDLDGALTEVRTAQRLDPTSWTAVVAGARSYSHTNDPDKLREAIVEYRRALTLSPKNPLILAELAMAYNAAGMDHEAEATAAEALAIDGSLVHVHLMNADRALARGDAETALATAEKVLAMRPNNPIASLLRADALAMLGRRDDAIAAYRTTLEVYKTDGRHRPEPRIDEIRAALDKGVLPESPYTPPSQTPARQDGDAKPPKPKAKKKRIPPVGGADLL